MTTDDVCRCARNCFNCPICFSQLAVCSMIAASKDGPWILNCNYCMWTSLEIGIKFGRPTNIRAQLDKIANGGRPKAPSKPAEVKDPSRKSSYLSRESYSQISVTAEDPLATDQQDDVETTPHPAARFSALKSFYKHQLSSTAANDTSLSSISGDFSYSSPASLARIMNLYSTSGTFQPKKKAKSAVMREALYPSEGLHLPSPSAAPEIQRRILSGGFSNTTSLEQRHFQSGPGGGNPDARFVDELRPMPALLATKRAKRCRECRHILVKPEAKPTSTRHRIKLVALSYIPTVSVEPIPGTAAAHRTGPSAILGGDVVLDPRRPTQWILKLRNPLFDSVKVSIATPAVTPGKHGHRVTILCPQFGIGANSDVWDEALDSRRDLNAAMSATSISAGAAGGSKSPDGAGGGAAEAGKVYEKGRNWTSVVLEVVPVAIAQSTEDAGEDEDVLEVPIRVRLEWTQGDLDDGASRKPKLDEEMVDDGKRELAYWMVLGLGRVKM